MLESKLQRDIRLHLGQKPDLVIWRNNVGQLQDAHGTHVRYGLCPGSSDLIGILKIGSFLFMDGEPIPAVGRFIAFEIKGQHGRLSAEQHAFIALVNKAGGYAAVLRSVVEAEEHYQSARQGLSAPGSQK